MSEIKISLSEDTFRKLVNGEVAGVATMTIGGEKCELLIALQDIGFDRMQSILDAAQRPKGKPIPCKCSLKLRQCTEMCEYLNGRMMVEDDCGY